MPSTSATSLPRARRFSAASMPMKPPPTTTIFFVSGRSTQAFSARMSVTLRMAKTFARSMPAMLLGITGRAPGASTSLS